MLSFGPTLHILWQVCWALQLRDSLDYSDKGKKTFQLNTLTLL